MRKTKSLSSHLGVTRNRLERAGVFDATLGIDTKLFIDPKLLVNSRIPEFKDSRQKILDYFNVLIRAHKQSIRLPRLRKEAIKRLAIPEPIGLCIGYGNKTDRGTAIPKNVAKNILASLSEILAVGIEDEELIEILGLFVEGFGADRISDLTVHILYDNFCRYTQRVAARFDVSTQPFNIGGVSYQLPVHPFRESQIIFIPLSLLRPLPIAVSWDEIAEAASHNEELRTDFDKIARESLEEAVRKLHLLPTEEQNDLRHDLEILVATYKGIEVKPYSLISDPRGYYGLYPFVDSQAKTLIPSSKPTKPSELVVSVRELIERFRRSVEENGGNRLLYRKTSTGVPQASNPHNEDVIQILFYLIADVYCSFTDIMLSRESNAGLGPVDFSLGTGYRNKVVVEIKKSNNTNLKSGYLNQVKAYETSERAHHSFYVVVKVKPVPKSRENLTSQLQEIVALHEKNVREKVACPELVVVDGILHPSPSKRR